MGKKKVTLSIEEETYKQFQSYCEENDIMLSKRIERIMKKELQDAIKFKSFSSSKKLDEFLRGDADDIT